METITEKDIKYFVNKIKQDHSYTGWFTFAEDDNYTWAVVFGWLDDGYDKGLLVKTAYCPRNSAMNQYEFDWRFPRYKDSEEDDDTEVYFEDGEDLLDRVLESIPFWNSDIARFTDEYVGKYVE